MKTCLSVLSALLALLLVAACGSNQRAAEAAPGSTGAPPRFSREGPAVVVGTAVEASTGLPIAGAEIVGPDGTRTSSDEAGRFELRGMALGTGGPLLATSAEGLEGRILLRPLAGGRLEVVIHLR